MKPQVHSLTELIQLRDKVHDNFDGYDLSEVDFSTQKGQEILQAILYSSSTIFPEKIHSKMMDQLEKGKNLGLNLQAMHNAHYNGTNIKIAIIDQNTDVSHPALKGHVKDINFSSNNDSIFFHGLAVDSIAARVAPEADIIHLGIGAAHNDELADKALEYILDYNKKQKDESNKIRFVSCSWGKGELSIRRAKLFEELETNGTMVIGGCWGTHEALGKKKRLSSSLTRDLSKSPNDVRSYQECAIHEKLRTNCVAVLRNNFTFASKNRGYIFDPIGGASWTYPYLAGVGACALQANPDFVVQKGWQDKLWQLMLETGVPVSEEPNANRIIQPAKLCEQMHEMYLANHKSYTRKNGKGSR